MSRQIIQVLFLSLLTSLSLNALANEEGDNDADPMQRPDISERRAEMAERFANMTEEERQAAREEFQNMDRSDRRDMFEDSEIAERLRNMTPEEREIAIERFRNFNQNRGFRGNRGEETL